jgi:hypothetical protein
VGAGDCGPRPGRHMDMGEVLMPVLTPGAWNTAIRWSGWAAHRLKSRTARRGSGRRSCLRDGGECRCWKSGSWSLRRRRPDHGCDRRPAAADIGSAPTGTTCATTRCTTRSRRPAAKRRTSRRASGRRAARPPTGRWSSAWPTRRWRARRRTCSSPHG